MKIVYSNEILGSDYKRDYLEYSIFDKIKSLGYSDILLIKYLLDNMEEVRKKIVIL